jgi:hypothetical protein
VSTPPSWGMPYWLAALAAVLAVVLAYRRAEHRPVAAFLVAMVAIDVGRLYLRNAFHLDVPGPYVGAQRIAFHGDEAGFLAWPAGLAALALAVFEGRRRPWPPVAAWAVVWVALVALYPSDLVRGDGLRRVYFAAFLTGLVVVVATLVRWTAKKAKPSSEHAVLFLLLAAECVRVVSFSGAIAPQWGAWMPPGNGVLYAVIAAVQGVFLWVRQR